MKSWKISRECRELPSPDSPLVCVCLPLLADSWVLEQAMLDHRQGSVLVPSSESPAYQTLRCGGESDTICKSNGCSRTLGQRVNPSRHSPPVTPGPAVRCSHTRIGTPIVLTLMAELTSHSGFCEPCRVDTRVCKLTVVYQSLIVCLLWLG